MARSRLYVLYVHVQQFKNKDKSSSSKSAHAAVQSELAVACVS